MTIVLPIFCLVISLMLFWFLIGTRGNILLKIFVLVSIHILSCMFLYSLSTFMGWSSSYNLPKKFTIQWILVQEPIKSKLDPGFIYLWVIPENVSDNVLSWMGYNASLGEPRAYKVQYNRKFHEQLLQIVEDLKSGKKVIGEVREGKQGDDLGSESQKQEIELHILPPPIYTDKY